MSAREVVTIQCGHYSSFIGAHWWNLQESGFCYDATSKEPREILHDCLFREGLTLTGQQTYTPRLIAIDLPGSLKTLKEGGVLYDTQLATSEKAGPVLPGVAKEVVWQGGVEVHETEPVAKNEYLQELDRLDRGEIAEARERETKSVYDLDRSVEVWSDFLRLHLHSKSLLMVPGHFHNDSNESFAPFPSGLNVWENRKFRTELEDKLHFFVEECDHLQGFHLLCDWTDGFGGLGSCIAEHLRDEFGAKEILTFLSSPLDTPIDKLPRFHSLLFNHLLGLCHISEHSSVIVPLSLLSQPWLSPPSLSVTLTPSFNTALSYHTSALFASALETATLFYRTHHHLTSLPLLTDTLTARGRKIASLGISLPFSLPHHGNLATQLALSPLPFSLSPLSPFANHHDNTIWSLATSLRGVPSNYPLWSGQDTGYSGCRHPSHVLAIHLSRAVPSVNSQLCCIEKPLPLTTPFPNILPAPVMKTGNTPVCASLQTQSGTKQLLLSLLSLLNPTKLRQFPAFSESCLDQDSCAELSQSITTLADCYSVGEPLSEEDSD